VYTIEVIFAIMMDIRSTDATGCERMTGETEHCR